MLESICFPLMKLKIKYMKRIFLLAILILIASSSNYLLADQITLSGQASAWAVFNGEDKLGLRYIPEFRASRQVSDIRSIDAEVSVNAYVFGDDSDIKLYRGWLRYTSSQFWIRAGLQKINFGPAKILRSLKWFDRLDARDPLELTDGVYALLGRYYFLDNSNIWVWGLLNNDDLKGLELYKSNKDKAEFGGRFQMPVPQGEMAASFNRRHVDSSDYNNKETSVMSYGMENRYALDGHWDVGPGLWFEASAGKIEVNRDESLWQKFLTVGTDYTFDILSGIHILCEHFVRSSGPKLDENDDTYRFSALSADLGISMLDTITAIGYYDWEEEKIYSYLGLQRTYDNWLVDVSIFSGREDGDGIYGGTGVQCMLTFNH